MKHPDILIPIQLRCPGSSFNLIDKFNLIDNLIDKSVQGNNLKIVFGFSKTTFFGVKYHLLICIPTSSQTGGDLSFSSVVRTSVYSVRYFALQKMYPWLF